ncbi:MAG: oligosaccharide repeat unit polymerase [Bacteroidales bacterium]|jgi:oligosaccharide repeat unit polymerase|nr:oligosaccharide repeat unit polymerase [Bacteroidales bacterium]
MIIYTLVIFCVLFKCCRIKDIYNPAVIFLIFHFVFLFVALAWTKNYEISKMVYISDRTVFFVIYSMTLSTIIVMVYSIIQNKRNRRYTIFNEWNLLPCHHIQATWILFIIGIVFWILFVLKAGQIPIFHSDIENFRIEARKGTGYIMTLSIVFILYSGLYLMLGIKKKIVILMIFLVASFILLSFGNREQMIRFILSYCVLLFIKYKIKINLIQISFFVIVIYFLVVLLGAYRMNVDIPIKDKILLTIGWRPYVNLQNLDILITNFKDVLYGKGYLIDLFVLLPGYNPNLGTWIKETLQMEFDGGSLTITYLGDGFVNFGTLGLIVYPLLYTPFFLKLNKIFRTKYLKNNTILPGHAILFLNISISLGGTISSGILSPILYNVFPMYIVYKIHTLLAKKSKM